MKHTILYITAPALDGDHTAHALLLEARRAYFTDPDSAMQRTRLPAGDDATCVYRFRKNGFYWRVMQGMKTLQREQKTKTGYTIQWLLANGQTRTDHFSAEHQLTRIEYFSGTDCTFSIEVLPDGSLDAAAAAPEGGLQHETLYPCPCVPCDGESHLRYTRILGAPQALMYTTEGILCCYNADRTRHADELKIQFAAEDRAPEAESAAPPQPETEEPNDAAFKRRLACGRIQKGQLMVNETPVHGILTFDDRSSYTGDLVRNLPHGTGTMTSAEGEVVYQGQWRAGKRHGTGTSYENGIQIYSGGWEANRYQGQGILRQADGSTLSGRFNMGSVIGPVTQRNAADQLMYEGRMKNGLPHGSGTMYRNGEPVAEGTFEHGVLNGSGKLYSAGKLVYVGEIRSGARWGVGASLDRGGPAYFGQWEADEPHGAGMRYRDHQLEFVGSFVHGEPDDRVDLYRDGQLYRKITLRRGAANYMIEYENGHPVYVGCVKNDQRHGAGRLLNEYGECVAQGIFRNGTLHRKTQVIPRPFPPLACPPELHKTPYEQFACPAESYELNLPWEGGLYSGAMLKGLPHGLGSLVYSDHTFAGTFRNGVPNGIGTLTLADGTVITGTFSPDGAEQITCGAISYRADR